MALSVGARRAIIKARPILRVLNKPVMPELHTRAWLAKHKVADVIHKAGWMARKVGRRLGRRAILPIARAAQASPSPTARRAYGFARATGKHVASHTPGVWELARDAARAYVGYHPPLMAGGLVTRGTRWAAKKAGELVGRLAPTAREKGLVRAEDRKFFKTVEEHIHRRKKMRVAKKVRFKWKRPPVPPQGNRKLPAGSYHWRRVTKMSSPRGGGSPFPTLPYGGSRGA